MAKEFKVDFSGVTDGGKFYVAPGKYTGKVMKIEQDMGTTYPYLIWDIDVIDTDVTIKHNTSLDPKAIFNLYNVLGALLARDIPKSVVKIDPEKFIGKLATITVADREYNGKMYSNIVKFEKYVASEVAGDEDEI